MVDKAKRTGRKRTDPIGRSGAVAASRNGRGAFRRKRRSAQIGAAEGAEREAGGQAAAETLEPEAAVETPAAEPVAAEAGAPNAEQREELVGQVERLIERLRRLTPGYLPPPFSPAGLMKLIEESVDKLSPDLQLGILEKLRKGIGQDLFDVDTWKGMWYMLNYAREYQVDLLKRRVTGEYETDEWGLDREYLDTVRPFFDFLYKNYWRVEMNGLENVPAEGRAMLVSNHSGQLPWDAAMVATGIYLNHPNQRLVRSLYATWFPTLPVLADLFTKCGQVLATEENGIRLLEQDQLVAVYPEGYKGVGKLFRERYRLARFGRGGFVKMALKTGTPIIPAAVVGAEETYISLAKSSVMAKLTGFPYFPISPTFPWFGLLGFVPLPTKWYIDIGEPIPTGELGPNAADNIMVVSQLTDRVRNVIQDMILERLSKRRSVFLG